MTTQFVALVLSWCAVAALAAIGITAIAAPRFLSKNYGVPLFSEPELAWVRAAGARDIVLALFLAIALWGAAYELAGAFCGVAAALASFDCGIVIFANRGKVAPSILSHIAGALFFSACFLLLLHIAVST